MTLLMNRILIKWHSWLTSESESALFAKVLKGIAIKLRVKLSGRLPVHRYSTSSLKFWSLIGF